MQHPWTHLAAALAPRGKVELRKEAGASTAAQWWIGAVAIATAALALVGASRSAQGQADAVRGKVAVDGSSTVYPITEKVADAFSETMQGVDVNVGVSGTGGGFKRFTVGETDISDASRPIKVSELKKAADHGIDFIEVPVAYDGLTIAVNPENHWAEQMSVEDLKKIFAAKNTARTWQQVNPHWPDQPINRYIPGTDSGTFDYFKQTVVGEDGKIADMNTTASEDDNVLVRGITGDKNAIGFFGFAYYAQNKDKLKAIKIKNPEGKFVRPTQPTIQSGAYQPFSRPLFIYVNRKSLGRPAVARFVEFYFNVGGEMAEQVGYVRLPLPITINAQFNVQDRNLGTQFLTPSGDPVDGPITKVYKNLASNATTKIADD